MKTTIKSGLKIKASIKAGAFGGNHVRTGLKIRAGIKAGYILMNNNHNISLIAVR